MKHFRVGKNAQVVVYVVGNQLVTVVNFEGSARSMLFGRTYDGNYAHLNEENLLPDYHAFNEAEALLMANRAGEVEPLDEESGEPLVPEGNDKDLVGSASFDKIAVHADITEEDIKSNIAPEKCPKAISELNSLEMSEPQLIKK